MESRRNQFWLVVQLAVVSLAPLIPGIGWAETLPEAWDVAVAADRRLAAASAQTESTRFSLDAARSERYPSIDLGASSTQLDDAPRFTFGENFVSPELVGNDNILTGSGQISLPLYTGGMLRDRIASADATVDASEYHLAAMELDVKLAVAQAYIDVLRGERALGVAQSVTARLQAHTADTKNRFDSGAVPKNDYLAAAVSLADAEQRELQATNALDVSRSAYNRRLGRALTERVVLDPVLPAMDADWNDEGIDQLVVRALDERHELRALDAQASAFRLESSAIRRSGRPQMGLSGGYTYLENEVLDQDDFWWVGVGVNWKLFDGGRIRNQAAAVEHQATAVARKREDVETIIALEVRQAWLDWQEAEQRTTVSQSAVRQADENLKVTIDRYQAGAGTNTEVLDAQALRALSLNNRDNAIFDTALARMRLARAIGEL